MSVFKKHLVTIKVVITIVAFVLVLLSAWGHIPQNSCAWCSPQGKVKILIGVLTTASKLERRCILRMAYGVQLPAPGADVTVRYVLGRPTTEHELGLVKMEMFHYKDVMLLDCHENLNEGKSFAYFDALAEGEEHFDYVMKTDDDSYIRLENLVKSLQNLPRSDLYYGYILPCENMDPYQGYMAGMGYLLSWDLVQWIHSSPIARNATVGTEDKLVGSWLDAGGRAKFRVNKKPMFYDHPEFGGRCSHELRKDTILVHQVKTLQRWAHVLAYFQKKFIS